MGVTIAFAYLSASENIRFSYDFGNTPFNASKYSLIVASIPCSQAG